ncbi:MAG: hypothetical protein WCV84_04220 [Patescibacteria group bacterium]
MKETLSVPPSSSVEEASAVKTARNVSGRISPHEAREPDVDQKVEALLDKLFAGQPIDHEALSALMRMPFGPETATSKMQETLQNILQENPCSFDQLDLLMISRQASDEFREVADRALVAFVGATYAKKLENTAYREQLRDLLAFMDERLPRAEDDEALHGQEGPLVFKEGHRTLMNVLAFRESVGTREQAEQLIKAMDYHIADPELHYRHPAFFHPEKSAFIATEKGKDLVCSMNLSMRYGTKKQKNGENDIIQTFTREEREGNIQKTTFLDRMVFEEQHQNKATAKQVLRQSLAWMLAKNASAENPDERLQELSLYANLEKGGWYWMYRGFQWDKEAMLEKQVPWKFTPASETSSIEERMLEAYTKSQAADIDALKQRADGKQRAFDLLRENFVLSLQDKWRDIRNGLAGSQSGLREEEALELKQIDEEIERILADTRSQDPDQRRSVTPQRLGAVGEELLLIQDSFGQYHLLRQFPLEQARAQELGWEVPESHMRWNKEKGALEPETMSVGHCLMMGSHWRGKVELTEDGEQQGKALAQYAKSLNVVLPKL